MISLFIPAFVVLVLPRMFSEDSSFLVFGGGGADKGAPVSSYC